ncbi:MULTISPECIES: glycosyltransferase family 4 protein [unclassified Acinetobacter]|uniref:glycosyltransferase family 4 protein n=1 Tax=unclassified Acinetobacter TaxID=196816 RepID=UPI003AF55DE3
MKIAHVQVKPILSGAQQISYDILSSLKGEGHQLYIICSEFDENSDDFIKKFGAIDVEIITIGSLKRELGVHDFKVMFDLYDIFKKHKFDIIHTNSTKPGIFARIAARLANTKKIIHTVHGIAFHKEVNFFVRLAYYFAENLSTLFGHYNLSVNKFYKKYYPLVKTETVYNGCDYRGLSPLSKKNNDKIHFAFLGRLDIQKNPLEFIEAIYLLSHKIDISLYRFTIAGDGELKQPCENMIKKYGLEDSINMYGWVYDKSKFLNTIDVLCQPSLWEAFGLVFCEAAYFKIPAIAKKVEGIPEVVLDNKTGLLYDDGAEFLMQKMLFLINNSDIIKDLGNCAYEHVTTNFTIENMTSEYKKYYFRK